MMMATAKLPPEVARNVQGMPWEEEVARAFRDETPAEQRAREAAAAKKREEEMHSLDLIADAVERGVYGDRAREAARAALAKTGRNFYALQTVRNIARDAKRRGEAKKKGRR
jgi:hypothetical protein